MRSGTRSIADWQICLTECTDMTTAELFKDIQLLVLDVDGVMTDGRAYQDSAGLWRRTFSVRDSIGIRALMRAGIAVAVFAENESPEVRAHVQSLGVLDFFENCANKTAVIQELLKKFQLVDTQIAFVSENSNDENLFRCLACGVTVDGADSALQLAAHFVTSHRGGDGAVLEVCNLIMQGSGRLRGSERVKSKPGAGGPLL